MTLMSCPDCGKNVSDEAPSCIHCGRPLNGDGIAGEAPAFTLFPVAPHKLAIMSICTFGFYELYWAYQQWKRIRLNSHESISAFWRAVFAPFWGFSLFNHVDGIASGRHVHFGWGGGLLGLMYLVLNLSWRLPDPYWLVSFATFVPLVIVQRSINVLNAAEQSNENPNTSYTAANIVAIVIGGLLFLFAVLGTVMPSEQTDQASPVTLSLTIELDEGAGAVSGADDAVDRVILIIQSRLEEFGVRRPVLERVGRNRIVATLPRVRDAGRLREIITTRGFLEFRITDMQREFEGALDRIDRALVRAGVTVGERSASTVAPQTAIQQLLGAATDTTIQSGDSAAGADAVDVATERPSETIFSGFLNTGQLPGEVFVVEEDVPQVTRLMEHPEFQRNVPRGIDLLWGREPMSLGGRLYRGLYAVESRPIITGEQLSDAQAQLNPITNQAVVNFQLTRAGGRIFARATGEHVNDFMAIVLDGRVQGQPPVIRSQIRRQGQIELGNTSIGAAQDLALVLRIGALPVPIRIVEAPVDSGR